MSEEIYGACVPEYVLQRMLSVAQGRRKEWRQHLKKAREDVDGLVSLIARAEADIVKLEATLLSRSGS